MKVNPIKPETSRSNDGQAEEKIWRAELVNVAKF